MTVRPFALRIDHPTKKEPCDPAASRSFLPCSYRDRNSWAGQEVVIVAAVAAAVGTAVAVAGTVAVAAA